jgi:hypothetical protein
VLSVFCEDRGSDVEVGVRAVGCGFGCYTARMEGMKLGWLYGVGLADVGDVFCVDGGEYCG